MFYSKLRYMANLLNTAPITDWQNESDPPFSFPLREIYDAKVEALARAAYGQDYEELGYGDLF